MYVELPNGKRVKANWLLRPQRTGEVYFYPKIVRINGVLVYFSGMKYHNNGKLDFLAIASFRKTDLCFDIYKQRWQIETMFRAFKSSGFNLEDTHLEDYVRINKLLYIISVAFIWAYNAGIYRHENERPIKVKTHGRKEKSYFTYGLEKLAQILINKVEKELSQFITIFLSCT